MPEAIDWDNLDDENIVRNMTEEFAEPRPCWISRLTSMIRGHFEPQEATVLGRIHCLYVVRYQSGDPDIAMDIFDDEAAAKAWCDEANLHLDDDVEE